MQDINKTNIQVGDIIAYARKCYRRADLELYVVTRIAPGLSGEPVRRAQPGDGLCKYTVRGESARSLKTGGSNAIVIEHGANYPAQEAK